MPQPLAFLLCRFALHSNHNTSVRQRIRQPANRRHYLRPPARKPRQPASPPPSASFEERVRIRRTDLSRIEPLSDRALIPLPLLFERAAGEASGNNKPICGRGEESIVFEGFMGRSRFICTLILQSA